MKPAPFEYSRPADIDEACALLAADDGARLIAGGQTLVPLMAMRLARPTRLIDIARIPGLAYVRDEGDAIAIGATTRQHVVESDPLVRAKLPLLAKVMPFVGHARDAGARHRRRLARQRRSGGGDRAGGGDARRDAGLARRRQDQRDRGGGFLPRADGDGAAADRLPRRGALSGLARAAGRRRASTRSTRGRAISPSSRRRRRSRSMATAAARARPSASARRPPCRCGSMRSPRRCRASATTRPRCARRCDAALAGIETDGRSARLGRLSPARRRDARRPRHRRCLSRRREARMKVELDINKREAHGRGRAAHEPARLPARQAAAHRRARRLRARRLRRLHRADRRRAGALLPDVRGAGRRLRHHHHRGAVAGAGRAVAAAGRVLRDPRHAVRLLHAGDDPRRARAAVEKSVADARGDRRRHLRQHLPLHRLCPDRRGDRARRRAHARPERSKRGAAP